MAKEIVPMNQVLDVGEEEDENLIDVFRKQSNPGEVFVGFIAPYVGVRVSPSKYISASIGLSEEFGTETVIDKLREILGKEDPEKKLSKLHLLINSPGGFVHSSFKVAKALRSTFDKITVYVVHIAASGGTLISLAGNEIVMGTMSQLSPLDPSSNGESALSISRGFTTVTEFLSTIQDADIPYSYKSIANKFTAESIDSAQAALELMKQYADQILEKSGYDSSTSNNISNKLVEGCLDHSEVIDFEAAKRIGLKVVPYTKHRELWSAFRMWLGEYFLSGTDKHVIRYWVNMPEMNGKGKKKSQEKKEI